MNLLVAPGEINVVPVVIVQSMFRFHFELIGLHVSAVAHHQNQSSVLFNIQIISFCSQLYRIHRAVHIEFTSLLLK